MAQPSVSSFFITRKRGNEEELVAHKKKVFRLERFSDNEDPNDQSNNLLFSSSSSSDNVENERSKKLAAIAAVRQAITPQRTRSKQRLHMQNVDGIQTPKQANFYLGRSPQKKFNQASAVTEKIIIQNNSRDEVNSENSEQCLVTPTKKVSLSTNSEKIEKTLLIPSNIDDLKKKLRGSSRLTELKTSLNKLKNGFDKLDHMEKKRMAASATITSSSLAIKNTDEVKSLKVFKNIELEILSPKKAFASPIKLRDSPMKNTLIGSPKHVTPRKLFSPTKSSPVKALAYERFQALAEAGTPTLQLPFKYRYLLEMFKAVDTVCAMFFNRKEKITFKKLKPAVQRILRKNFYETHLAQIIKIMPNAYKFAQEKTRNFGSTSKQDYYQLVITPNLNIDNEDVCQLTLSPQILIDRTKEMTMKLTDLVYEEHDKFLQDLEIPMNVTRGALKRWHPDFLLEDVPDIEQGELPLPPNVEKFSCAKDILSTARNLFSCSTPMERALERLDAKKKDEKSKQIQNKEQQEAIITATPQRGSDDANDERKKQEPVDSSAALLKGIPKSLLEKIRAKQAAKALDTMTRRPSQERDAIKYSRLPEVARHVRNVFVTERKGVLPLENVLIKLQNSYKANVNLKEIEELLRLLSKEMPRWLSFHDIRNMMFVRVNRETDLASVIEHLQDLAIKKTQIQ